MYETVRNPLRRALTLLLALALALGVATLVAPTANARELNPNYAFQDGKCQKSVLDIDCYHDDIRVARHADCFTRLGKIIGIDPTTQRGKNLINSGSWYCQPQRPSGEYLLQIYHPTCPKVGWSSAQCRAWAQRH